MAQANRTANAVATRDHDVDVYDTDVVMQERLGLTFGQRVSWGAIFGGIFIAVAVQFTLYMLGLSIGAATVNPTTQADPLAGLGTGVVIWDAASTLIALLAGGYVAGRLAGSPANTDGMLHGLMVWAATVVLSIFVFLSGAGTFVNGTANLLSQSASALTNAAQAAELPEPVEDAAATLTNEINMEAVDDRVAQFISENTSVEIDEVPSLEPIREEVTDFMVTAVEDGVTDADREALTEAIVAETSLSEADVTEIVTTLETEVDQFMVRAETRVDQVQAQAAEAAGNAADLLASVAGIIFASLIVGAAAAGVGGFIAAPQEPMEVEAAT